MARTQTRQRQENNTALAAHGRREGETVKRLSLHTETFGQRSEAGQLMDRRIIIQEANSAMASLLAILSILAEGD